MARSTPPDVSNTEGLVRIRRGKVGLPDRQSIADELTPLVDESERCTTTAEFTEAAHAFHRRLTERCGNTTMMLLAGTLEALWSAQETRALAFDLSPDDAKERRSSITAHRRLISAIAAGNSERASSEMPRHLARAQELLIGELGSTVIDLPTTPVASPWRAVTASPAPNARGTR